MDKKDIKIRIEKLKTEIEKYRYAYHVLDESLISDGALDSLKNELAGLEQRYPDLITPDSPTQRVGGAPLAKFKKVRHVAPMISLFDAFSPADMLDWEKRLDKLLPGQKFGYYAELKMDGLAVSLVYEGGRFALGATRGDGETGEEVTQNLKTIEAIPLVLRRPAETELKRIGLSGQAIKSLYRALDSGRLEARGEAIMTGQVFKELNERNKKIGKPEFANPRNAAAGSIRQLDSKLTASRRLDCHIYSLATDFGLTTHEQEHELARALGFKVLKENKFCRDLAEVIKFHDDWEKRRDDLPFECDGVVVVVNDLALWPKLGVIGKGPRYMMAYKFAAIQATTKVAEVIWQVGRTGVLTPTAALTPVRIYGVTVSRATLHNLDEIKRLGLKIGDTVILERAGDVIPKVVQVLSKLRDGREKDIKAPKNCPMCGGPVEKVAGEVAYRCVNKNCYAVNLRRLSHWTSKNSMDIEGLGPKIIEQLYKQGLVRDPGDFYILTKDDLLPLGRFADKSAENLIKAISEKKQVELYRFIFALGIRHVGEETAMLLSKNLEVRSKKIFDLISSINNWTLADLEKLPDVGPIVAKSIFNWFHDKHNLELLNKLEKNGLTIKAVSGDVKQILAGKTFVLTGGLEKLTREQAKAKIRELGGEISSSVSKNTDYLVAGVEPGNKYEKAKKLKVRIMDEQEFLKIIS